MKVPVFVDLEKDLNVLVSNEFNINKEDPLDIYIDPFTLIPQRIPPVDTTLPFILSPRYYLLIKSPLDQNLPTIKINIHKSQNSLLRNQAQILLESSKANGLNSCYKVELWQWTPNLNLEADLPKKKLYTQYWFIPTLDENYVAQYPSSLYSYRSDVEYLFYNQPRLLSKKIEAFRIITTDLITNEVSVEDTILKREYSDIFYFPKTTYNFFKQTVVTEQLNYNKETQSWKFSKSLINSILSRNPKGLDGDLVNGVTNTTISYIPPFTPDQLIITDYNNL
jgi:hypothetical protein